jgi:cyclic beta-1,2-glucan synthetase
MPALSLETDFLRRILGTSTRTLQRLYRDLSQEPPSSRPRAAEWLLADRWFIESQIAELDAALSREYCRKLARCQRHWGRPEPRVYHAISGTLGCLVSSPLGPHALGRLLTTEALAELFSPERLGASLTLAELWAVPPILKLVLLEKIAQSLSTWSLASEQCEREVRSAMECLHSLGRIRWRVLIESISVVHHILSRDPAATYARMDFESRDMYRHVVENIAIEARQSEEYVATLCVALAGEASQAGGRPRETHVGYYLVGPGVPQVRSRGRLRASWPTQLRELALRAPNLIYIGSILALTTGLTAGFHRFLGPWPWLWAVLLWLPCSAPAIAIVNLMIHLALRRRRMPRLDFSQGIPGDCRTLVAVPTMLLSRSSVERSLERLEMHYLANRDPNLAFALLTDCPDSATPARDADPLLDFCVRGMRRLNRRYLAEGRAPFCLLHRQPEWNESQRAWMGRERKRGKLEDLNRLLLGVEDSFQVKIGDPSLLHSIRYVITLDADTQFPHDTAWKLVGTLAHPLHRPLVEPHSNLVREGYAILQPLVSTSMESAGKSRFARIFSGQTGFDPYTTAIADVYHDLYGRASFGGKGIYDLHAFHAVLDGRFPENSVLSHDVIEGEYARVGLVTDVDVVEDHPSSYWACCQRKHRWTRGDWQLLYWLFSRVPGGDGKWNSNPLPLISRWKLADNLRRSLFEINLLVWMLAAWMLAPAPPARIACIALLVLVLPAYAELAVLLFTLPPIRFWRIYFFERAAHFWRAHQQAFLNLVFLPHQAALMADAILRTLVRRFVTGRNLLEWQCMAQVEAACARGCDLVSALQWIAITFVAAFAVYFGHFALGVPLLFAFLWGSAPLVAKHLSTPPRPDRCEPPSDVEFLRDISLRTWRYFTDFSHPEDHWLVPDNVQEEPRAIAHRASPTNIGLQLASHVAASDFGYVTHQELAAHLGRLLDTLRRLEKYRGHFFNWYDTQTLLPLSPCYISTVDSGNCAAALVAVKQACETIQKQPLITASVLQGLRDHSVRLRKALPPSVHRPSLARRIAALIRQLEERPSNLFSWESVLREVIERVDELNESIDTAYRAAFEDPIYPGDDELRYWQRALSMRARAALAGLCELAPWLKSPYQEMLRGYAAEPRFEDLLAVLARVPRLGDLSQTYGAIEDAMALLLESALPWGSEPKDLLLHLHDQIGAARMCTRDLLDRFAQHASSAWHCAHSMDFAFLFDPDREQLHIGYNPEAARLDECCYDLLASEARTAVFFAVAKGDVPCQAWFYLGRKIASFRGYRTLVSWSGTMFEYLMPSIFMKTFAPSLLGEALNGVVQVQQAFAREQNVPWGISESSCSARNRDMHYRYRAFGIPAVSLSRTPPASLVVAPYASMLALMIDRQVAAKNLHSMARRGWTGRYGFFEAVDFQAGVSATTRNGTIVRSFMAHHQGMGLLALCNALLGNAMQKRFHAEPIVAAAELLLQERVPARFAAVEN